MKRDSDMRHDSNMTQNIDINQDNDKVQDNNMNRGDNMRVPIRERVLKIVLMTALIGLLGAIIAGFVCIRYIKQASESALTRHLESNLKSIVQQKAIAADARLEHYEKYIELVTDYIESMYTEKEKMIRAGRIFYPPADTDEYALTRGVASADLNEENLKDEILFFSNLEKIWDLIARANENLITTVYAGSKSGLLTSYDRWSYLSVPPEGEELVYDFFESDWYKQGQKEDGVFYTGLYVDSMGRGLTITIASPFRDENGEFMGVDSADFDITGLYKELISIDLGEGTMSFAMDQDGKIISPGAGDLSVEEYTGLTPQELDELRADPDGILEKSNAVYVCIPIERVGWTLCASVPKEIVQRSVQDTDESLRYVYLLFILFMLIIMAVDIYAANKAAASITHPMELLGKDIKVISDGNLDYRAKVYRNDEIGDITIAINEMVDRLKSTMDELMTTQQHAHAMSELATKDSLTGIRNKTAYDEHIRQLEQEMVVGRPVFGLAMIDLNNLKVINDSYGHDKGDIALIGLSNLICEIFSHSAVFRLGGDEFACILKDRDYRISAVLINEFKKKIAETSGDERLQPWERISAAIGYATYDPSLDKNAESVLMRADQEMYECKKMMKRKQV